MKTETPPQQRGGSRPGAGRKIRSTTDGKHVQIVATVTPRCKELLTIEAQKRGISRSELIEQITNAWDAQFRTE